eukprot:4217618-Pleurochrysis_carterae.AAC.1
MSEAVQAAAVRLHTGDCAQHVRNIILAAMLAAAAHLKAQLADSLADFAAYERMSTDINALICAVYKELHHEGAYAKGNRRREFVPWHVKVHGGTPYIPLERAAC